VPAGNSGGAIITVMNNSGSKRTKRTMTAAVRGETLQLGMLGNRWAIVNHSP